MFNLLLRLNQYLFSIDSFFNTDVAKELIYLDQFQIPVDCIDRSFFQYKCQMIRVSSLNEIFINLFAFCLLIPITFILFIGGSFILLLLKNPNKNSAVCINFKIHDHIPDSLQSDFQDFEYANFGMGFCLLPKDFFFIGKFRRVINHPFFILKCIYKIAMYRWIMVRYSPSAIISSSEYSFTSSVLTYFCRVNDVKHINIMHGDKLLNIRDTFFEFDRCYIWDGHYRNLFLRLRAEDKQFIIEPPKPFDSISETIRGKRHRLTYYLQGFENENDLLKIEEILSQFKFLRNDMCIRLHPRPVNGSAKILRINKIFEGFTIEEPILVSIQDSFLKTDFIVSIYSSVLYQGYINNKKIVIDDMSNPVLFSKLDELGYIMMKKNCLRISDLLEIVE